MDNFEPVSSCNSKIRQPQWANLTKHSNIAVIVVDIHYTLFGAHLLLLVLCSPKVPF